MTAYEIKYDSDQHRKVLREIQERHQFSRRYMERRYPEWRRCEERFRAYRPTKEEDASRKAKRDAGTPQYTTLEVPYSYAILMTAHTYWTSVLMGRSPIMQFAGRHGEAEMKIQAIEAIIDYQMQVGKLLPSLFVWLLDTGKYGIGVLGTYWEEEKRVISKMADVPVTFYGIPVPGKTKRVKQTAVVPGYKGNKTYNVRPYDFFPDPRVPVSDLQKGEFCGRATELGWNQILKRKERGMYFNTDVLEKALGMRDDRERGSEQVELPARDDDIRTVMGKDGKKKKASDFVNILEMYIELVPKDWGLGNGTYPEKWVFTLANDKVIIGAQPMGLLHDKFPFDILEYEVDGYSHTARGMLEISNDLNDILTWLFNTHMFNIRKALNDMFVVDPSRVTMKDFETEGAGRLIRLKPTAYGSDVRSVVTQFNVVDVTGQHMKNTQVVAEMIQRVLGVTENMMGLVNAGGRKTATEVRTSSSAGANRMKTTCEYFSACGFAPWGEKMVSNSQQFYDQEMNLRIAGDLIQGPEFFKVTPELITGFFDLVPVDGTLPIDRFAQANLWKEVLVGMADMPQLAMQYDIGKIFAFMAQLGGLKNINQFKIKAVPDAMLNASAAAGNSIPLGGPSGGPGTIGGTEGGAGLTRPISGVGPTG